MQSLFTEAITASHDLEILIVQENIKWNIRSSFKQRKCKTVPALIDHESNLSGATKMKATGKEYEKRKRTNGIAIHTLHKHVGSLPKNPSIRYFTPSH